MSRIKMKKGARPKAKTTATADKLISLHRRHFVPAVVLPSDQRERYSLEQPFLFPSVQTVTTTSITYGATKD